MNKVHSFLRGVGFAIEGIGSLIKNDRNFKIHIFLFALVCMAGIYFQISVFEWISVFMISALVISLEIINSAIERLCDLYSVEQNPKIKIIKDICAAAVLIAALFSVAIGILIFGKYLN